MSPEAAAAAGFAAGAVTSFAVTPVAIGIARWTAFYDHPQGYHRHVTPTPLLGGVAVVAGFLAAAAVVGPSARLLVLLWGAVALWLLGTIDDRVPVAPKWRLLAETGVAVALFAVGLGWKTSGDGVGDLVLTVVWVVGLVNGFNLMDNLDGACSTVACVSAAGIGTLAAIHRQSVLAGLAFGLAGACAAFLCWNLRTPAKVFLGDGGSRPIGLLVAGLAMATSRSLHVGDASVLVAALMVGVVILDTALVSVSRLRRGVTLVTGGRDHLTHRLLPALRAPRAVAAALAIAQGTLCALAITGDSWGPEAVVILALSAVSLGVVAVAVLDSARWRPLGIASRSALVAQPRERGRSVRVEP